MPRFYLPGKFASVGVIDLPKDVANHIWVLRLRVGELITLFNGDGDSYTAKIIEMAKRNIKVEILELNPNPLNLNAVVPNHDLKIALCLISSDKLDFAVQKLVELGVGEIILVESSYSKQIKADKLDKKMEHLLQIIISSCEQCGLNKLPTLNPPLAFDQFLLEAQTTKNKFILSLYGEKINLKNVMQEDGGIFLIGPEGGFTKEEEQIAMDKFNFVPVKLNTPILRAETAAIAIAAIAQNLS